VVVGKNRSKAKKDYGFSKTEFPVSNIYLAADINRLLLVTWHLALDT